LINESLGGAGVDVHPAYEVAHRWTVVGMVDAELGVAVLPSYANQLAQFTTSRSSGWWSPPCAGRRPFSHGAIGGCRLPRRASRIS
jgi:hypothetical protein